MPMPDYWQTTNPVRRMIARIAPTPPWGVARGKRAGHPGSLVVLTAPTARWPAAVARPRARRSLSEDRAGVRPRSCALNGFRDSTHVEAVEDDIEPVFELIAVVVAGHHDVLREELDQVRVLVDRKRLEHGLG